MDDHIKIGQRVLSTEITALQKLKESLDKEFSTVIDLLKSRKGRIILTGVGKSGHVARKVSATLASTGSPSLYIHPTEASHGDMGMILEQDCVIALSKSGETTELADIIGYCRRFSIPLIGMTAMSESSLGRACNHLLLLPDVAEACAETRAPTTSTTLQIALGDALAVALLEAKGFTTKDFRAFHPGGKLGASLTAISDLMHKGDRIPIVKSGTPLIDALSVMSEKGFGCVGVTNNHGKLEGIVTDGDLRRRLSEDLSNKIVDDIMTTNPKTTLPQTLAADALRDMTSGSIQIMQLFVVDNKEPVGIIHLHDFLHAGLI